MLQLSGTLRNASSRLTPMSSWRMPAQQLIAACSGFANPSPALTQIKEEEPADRKPKDQKKKLPVSTNPMVKKVFEDLKFTQNDPESSRKKETAFESQLKLSDNVGALLKMVEDKNITPENAHAMITLLIGWVNNGKAKLSDFELDNRFLHLCDLLSQRTANRHTTMRKKQSNTYLDDLKFFYDTDEIDGANKEVANLNVKQIIKVMTALAQQKRRTTPLLRSLTFNISRSGDQLNVKQSSDLLYSLASLNYPDEVLLAKISNDLVQCMDHVEKSAVVGSIITSLGMLRYKNEALMDVLSDWIVEHSEVTRPQDLSSFFVTLAMLGYKPANVDVLQKEIVDKLKESDMTKPVEWLDVVWALMVLELGNNQQIASVLNEEFIRKLADLYEIPVPKQHKLLNINGAANFLAENYKGPLLESNSNIFDSPIQRSKEKQMFARSVTTAIENIFPAPNYSKINVNTGMGFLLDAEFCVDSEGKRLPVQSDSEQSKGFRIAVISLCYNDFCRGKQDPVGLYDAYSRMLEAKGYKVLIIPYTEFSTEDKIVQRILYIQNQINKIIAK